MTSAKPATAAIVRGAFLLAAALLAGCASAPSVEPGFFDKALELVGLKKPDLPEIPKVELPALPRKVTLRVHAGEQLNTDPNMRSLSIVVRVYKLRSTNAFLLAPYSAFGKPDAEKTAFGADVVESREMVMTPGQKHEVVETLPVDAPFLAVAALFRAPAEGRWRFAFPSRDAEKSGITLGLHGCAISVAAGQPEGAAPEAMRLAGVRCTDTQPK